MTPLVVLMVVFANASPLFFFFSLLSPHSGPRQSGGRTASRLEAEPRQGDLDPPLSPLSSSDAMAATEEAVGGERANPSGPRHLPPDHAALPVVSA